MRRFDGLSLRLLARKNKKGRVYSPRRNLLEIQSRQSLCKNRVDLSTRCRTRRAGVGIVVARKRWEEKMRLSLLSRQGKIKWSSIGKTLAESRGSLTALQGLL